MGPQPDRATPGASTVAIGGTEIVFVEQGDGAPLLLVHGSLCDYRYWALQMAAFGATFRTIAVSLRHYYPEQWDGVGDDFTVDQHVRDLVAFIDARHLGPVHIVAHSRGARVAFHLAHRHPERVRKLVLAEPGGVVDAALSAAAGEINARFTPRGYQARALEVMRAGRVDDGLAIFVDAVTGASTWAKMPEIARQFTRDNAATLFGQVKEPRVGFTRAAAKAIAAPTLLVLGTLSPLPFAHIVAALAEAMPNAKRATIEGASHTMNVTRPDAFNAAVLEFLHRAAL